MRLSFPSRPLDLSCEEPSDRTPPERVETVRLVQLVIQDFDPASDPRGWDAVAAIVRDSTGRSRDDIADMTYAEVDAFFRINAAMLRKGRCGGVNYAIETNTVQIVTARTSVVAAEATGAFSLAPAPLPRKSEPPRDTSKIDADAFLEKLRQRRFKQYCQEFKGDKSAAGIAVNERVKSLSSQRLLSILQNEVGYPGESHRPIQDCDTYKLKWHAFRHPSQAITGRTVASVEAVSSSGVTMRTGARADGRVRLRRPKKEKDIEDATRQDKAESDGDDFLSAHGYRPDGSEIEQETA